MALCLTSTNAWADSITYGNFVGSNVTFFGVTEESGTDPVPLFGEPDVLDNTLEFDPIGFDSVSSASPDADITDSELRMEIGATTQGFRINSISIDEAGDYTLVGPPGAFGSAQVAAAYFLKVVQVEFGPLFDGPSTSGNVAFTPSGGTYELPGDAGSGVIWTGAVTIDVAQLLADNGIIGRATRVELKLDNSLSTATDGGASSFIKKKEFGTNVSVGGIIPEPGAALLLATGLALVARLRRWL